MIRTHVTSRTERWALLVLLAFTLTATLGYWNFALHPERLGVSPMAARFYAISFQFFAQIHIALSAVALAVVLVGRLRARWIPALVAVYALSFFSEHMGTGYGIPFGGYGYTGLLGAKLGGRVPALIPLSWFLMSLPAWIMARSAFPAAAWRRVAVGALLLVAWDLALDPAMSALTPYWIWEESGPYYGMPWVNLFGWFVTGAAIMTVLELLDRRLGLDALPARWMAAYYLVVLLMPLGMLLAAGEWLAVGVTAVGVGICGVLVAPGLRPVAPLEPAADSPAGSAHDAEPAPPALVEVG